MKYHDKISNHQVFSIPVPIRHKKLERVGLKSQNK